MTTPAAPTSDYVFGPEEHPFFPGAPYMPRISKLRIAAYAGASFVMGIGSTFPNNLVNANVASIYGYLGLDLTQALLLPAVFVAMNATSNLALVKSRARFGLPPVVMTALGVYLFAALLKLVWPNLGTEIFARAANGVSSAMVTALSVFYLLQVFPKKARPLAITIGVAVPQLANPLARMVPVEWLATNSWHGLNLCEVASALILILVAATVRLPPTDHVHPWEKMDALSIPIFVGGFLPLCFVLSLGRTLWWTDTPWLGTAIAVSIGLLAIGVSIEMSRDKPLLQLSWLGTPTLLRFVGVALMVRFALAEQSYGSIGLLTSGGLNNDQLRGLFGMVAIGIVLGTIAAALTVTQDRLPWQILVGVLMIATAAFLDSHVNSLSRPAQLYFSQTLIGFGTALFIGAALLYGLVQALERKTLDYLITLVVTFSTSQNIGALIGSAALGSYQTIATRGHQLAIASSAPSTNPLVAARLQQGAAGYASTIVDPAGQTLAGTNALSSAISTQANVLGYIDVFRVLMYVALATALYIALALAWRALKKPASSPQAQPS